MSRPGLAVLLLLLSTACGGDAGASASTDVPVPADADQVMALYDSSVELNLSLNDVEDILVEMGSDGVAALEEAEKRAARRVADLRRAEQTYANQDDYDRARTMGEKARIAELRVSSIARALERIQG